MNTMQADLSATLERFRADMATRDASTSDRMATLSDRMATLSDRMATDRWWQTAILVGAMTAVVGIATAIIIYSLNT